MTYNSDKGEVYLSLLDRVGGTLLGRVRAGDWDGRGAMAGVLAGHRLVLTMNERVLSYELFHFIPSSRNNL